MGGEEWGLEISESVLDIDGYCRGCLMYMPSRIINQWNNEPIRVAGTDKQVFKYNRPVLVLAVFQNGDVDVALVSIISLNMGR